MNYLTNGQKKELFTLEALLKQNQDAVKYLYYKSTLDVKALMALDNERHAILTQMQEIVNRPIKIG